MTSKSDYSEWQKWHNKYGQTKTVEVKTWPGDRVGTDALVVEAFVKGLPDEFADRAERQETE